MNVQATIEDISARKRQAEELLGALVLSDA